MDGKLQATCEASLVHGSELADARAAVWQSAASHLQDVRDAAESLAASQVRACPPLPPFHNSRPLAV